MGTLDDLRAKIAARERPHAEAIAINKTGELVTEPRQGFGAEKPINIDFDAFADKMLNKRRRADVEDKPRDTVLKMLQSTKLDEIFTFKTTKNEGENYVQAMRQVLSRARRKANKKSVKLDDFKLLTHKIETLDDYDHVELIRTKNMSEHEASVYDDLIKAFAKD